MTSPALMGNVILWKPAHTSMRLKSLAADIIERTVAIIKEIKVGDPADFRNFKGAVISPSAFDSIKEYIDHARAHSKIVAGGGANKEVGYLIEPTLVEAALGPRYEQVKK